MKAVWTERSGVDEHFELEIMPDVVLALHRQDLGQWQAMLFDVGFEESPFLMFVLKSKTVHAAKREAIRRTTVGLSKLLDALARIKVAA